MVVDDLLGATDIRDQALHLEKAARQGESADSLKPHLDVLTISLQSLTEALDRVLTRAPDVQKSVLVNWSEVSTILDRLESFLKSDDAASNDLFDQSQPLLMAALGDAVRTIGQQIRDFDYSDALNTLHMLRKNGFSEKGSRL